MKKAVLGVLGTLVLAVAGFLAFVGLRPWPHFDAPKIDRTVEVTPEKVARGRKWALMLCAECHKDPATGLLTGQDMHLDDQFGSIWSLNITQDKEAGIGSWTDGELMVLLRTGIARDGRYTPPWMAKLPHMSDDDLEAVIAFLRSDDPMVQASKTPNHPSKPNFFSKFLVTVAFKPLPYPAGKIAAPDTSNQVAWGRYLTINADCWTCHSEDFSKINSMEPEKTAGFLGGGNPIDDGTKTIVHSTNLTPDETHGIGKWSEADFVRALRHGIRPDNSGIRFPMPAYTVITEPEAKAMYAYLKTVPKLARANMPRVQTPPPANADTGQRAYFRYGCNACHGEKGTGPMCDLTHNKEKYPTDDALKAFIREPSKTVPETKMPSWGEVIPEEDLTAIVAHLRALSVAAPAAPTP